MKKAILLFPCFIALVFFTGVKEKKINEHHNKLILLIAISYDIPHFQSEQEIAVLKKNKIKSMSLVEENVKSHSLDSLTYLEYNENGRIIRRTTKECTTFGCLPYMNRETFSYKGKRIIKMKDFVFKYKENSTYDKWTLKDTSLLTMFDWEDYSYNEDTTRVESGPAVWKYVKNNNREIIKQICRMKANNQLAVYNYDYNDSTIIVSMITRLSNRPFSAPYFTKYIADGNQVLIKVKRDSDEYLSGKWVFNSEDLPIERITYKDGRIYRKAKIHYTFYQ